MFLQDKDNSVQVSFKSGCHSLTPVLANFPSLSLFSFLVTVIQNVLAKYLYLIWVSWHCKYIVKLYLMQLFHEIFRITHNPITNSMPITDAEKDFEYDLQL